MIPTLSYERPQTLDEVLALIASGGIPIGGGTEVFLHRKRTDKIVDLQALEINRIQAEKGQVRLGATTKLQALIEETLLILPALSCACCQEASWNKRNMATFKPDRNTRDEGSFCGYI